MKKHKGIKVYDNGGKTLDRYTVIIDGDMYGMSDNAQGFNQYVGDYTGAWGDKLVSFESLNADVKRAIFDRIAD